jgi:hypothetical protein
MFIANQRRIPTSAEPSSPAYQAGMTLIELMIAGGIMAIAFVFLFGSLISISVTGATAADRSVAVAHLSSIMEELDPLVDEDGLLAYQPPAMRGLGVAETILVQCVDGAGNLVSLPSNPGALAAPLTNPVEVRVTISWRDKAGRTHRVRGATFQGI